MTHTWAGRGESGLTTGTCWRFRGNGWGEGGWMDGNVDSHHDDSHEVSRSSGGGKVIAEYLQGLAGTQVVVMFLVFIVMWCRCRGRRRMRTRPAASFRRRLHDCVRASWGNGNWRGARLPKLSGVVKAVRVWRGTASGLLSSVSFKLRQRPPPSLQHSSIPSYHHHTHLDLSPPSSAAPF